MKKHELDTNELILRIRREAIGIKQHNWGAGIDKVILWHQTEEEMESTYKKLRSMKVRAKKYKITGDEVAELPLPVTTRMADFLKL